jgi:hypothetical protein
MVRFTKVSDQREVLRKAKDLRNTAHKNVFIRPDLTKLQVAESKKLYGELKKAREDDLDKWFIIRHGRVISVPTKPKNLSA